MTTYYVDFVNGLDANNGLGPDASHAVNKPWKTIGKLLGAAGLASGDTAYLSPAGPFREVVTVNMTSAVAETQIIGDPANAQGFKDAGGNLVASGDVILTGWITNDTSAPSGSSTLNLNGRDYLTFKNISILAGTTINCVQAIASHSINIIFRDCAFFTSNVAIAYTAIADTASNWIIDRCYLYTFGGRHINIILPTSAGADYDSNFQIQNCQFYGGNSNGCVEVNATGAAAFKGGGVDIFNCDFLFCSTPAFIANNANLSTSIPCTIYNSRIPRTQNVGISANTLGQIIEDYNFVPGGRLNVAVGANSVATLYAPLYEFHQAFITGRQTGAFGMPSASSPFLGRGAQAGGPSVDIFNINRPAGGQSVSYAWGAMERHSTATRETSIVDAGSNAIKITGPGDHDLFIPVDAALTTITVRVRYDTNHAATNKPQATILNGEEIGVTTETKTAVAAVDTWETLTFTAFTPTAKGFVTLRLISRAAAGNGIAYFDTVTGGANGSQGLDYFRRGEPLQAAVASSSGGPGGSHILGGFIIR